MRRDQYLFYQTIDPFDDPDQEKYEIWSGQQDGLLTAEQILSFAWPILSPSPISGIYFLIFEYEIVYVGQSADISRRIAAHAKNRHNLNTMFHAFSYVECAPSRLDELEAEYIAALKPVRNSNLPPNSKWIPFWRLSRELGVKAVAVADLLVEHGIRSTNGYYCQGDIEALRQVIRKAGRQ